MISEGSIRPANSYSMTLGKDAVEYLNTFTEVVTLNASWAKSKEVKECYAWCEANMGAKYKDWYMFNDSIHFKDGKHATMFRLTWHHIIA